MIRILCLISLLLENDVCVLKVFVNYGSENNIDSCNQDCSDQGQRPVRAAKLTSRKVGVHTEGIGGGL